ncbi:MAG: ABC transporter substrate-binding protein, partial [Spirochaetaceae bacterium]|nr:ABC transporter substrate-binding protein [Spirochaetaceae bacterium]
MPNKDMAGAGRRRAGRHRGLAAAALAAAAMATAATAAACSPAPLKLGFVAELAGRRSEPGVAARNGALLAIDRLKERGIRAELVVRNDGGQGAEAARLIAELEAAGARLVIGPITSGVATEALAAGAGRRGLILSPTANSMALADRDDGFFMLLPTAGAEAAALAAYAKGRGWSRPAGIMSAKNRVFTENFLKSYGEGIGSFALMAELPAEASDYDGIARRVAASGADSVVLALDVLDAALMSQRLRRGGYAGPILSSDWAMARDLIANGGESVQGMLFAYLYDESSREAKSLAFVEGYAKRYGEEPSFSAYLGYEAVTTLAAAAEGGADPMRVRRRLIEGRFEGLQGSFGFDAEGD